MRARPQGFVENGTAYLSVHLADDPSPVFLVFREAARLLFNGTRLRLPEGLDATAINDTRTYLGVYGLRRRLARATISNTVALWETIKTRRGIKLDPKEREAIETFIEQARYFLRTRNPYL